MESNLPKRGSAQSPHPKGPLPGGNVGPDLFRDEIQTMAAAWTMKRYDAEAESASSISADQVVGRDELSQLIFMRAFHARVRIRLAVAA